MRFGLLGRTAVLCALLLLGSASAKASGAASAPIACPGYQSLMKAAARSLRAGDRQGALRKLIEARAALDACASQADSGSRLG